LDLFFDMHTPADPRWAGTQYRSAIFVHTPEQRAWAEQAVHARGALGRFVAVEEAGDFYAAEDYHQKYIEKMTGVRNTMDASEESLWM
jgi:peptide methionine sulfoxide reductase MsrA